MRLQKINTESDINLWNQIITNSPDFYTISHNPSLIIFLKQHMDWDGDQFFIMYKEEIIGVYQHSIINSGKGYNSI